jgi:membrane-bound metal-dependent hydrolase YbcI (DUF457 family)
MILLHYIIPLAIFQFYRVYGMLYGLLLGNLIDLDHIYYRIIGKVPWLESACPEKLGCCSFNFYPLHSMVFLILFTALALLIFSKNKKLNFAGWLFLGASLNILLDILAAAINFGI